MIVPHAHGGICPYYMSTQEMYGTNFVNLRYHYYYHYYYYYFFPFGYQRDAHGGTCPTQRENKRSVLNPNGPNPLYHRDN